MAQQTGRGLVQHAGRILLSASTKGNDYTALLTAAGMEAEGASARIVAQNAMVGS